jgi:NADH-quinone oxidoreductase subunit L
MLEAAWLIPAFPLAGFLLILLVGRRLGEPLAGWFGTAMMGGSFLATLTVFAGLLAEEEPERFFIQKIFTWVPAGSFSVDIGFLVDPLSIAMCLFITGVGTLIHLYSIGYMHGDPNYSKFFLYLNLFAASMLLLVLGDNLLLTFLGWEGVGACSYLLISFWFTSESNASAGKKAFVTNRIGDFGFMLGTFLVFKAIGSIDYADIIVEAPGLAIGTATGITLLMLLAATGKSAQIPLFVWLPDAMAGPTPVSALIHAATMVTSGVYLLTRLNPVLAAAEPWTLDMIAWVGAITGLVAALAAVVQNDIKKVLAYSTISQLGYLFMAIGVGAYVPAIFHMITHAFFKALLFLGSGSVIHGMHDEQDMRRMGGLYKFMPITAGTFIIGWLAIAGVPPFAGFWSKDEILLYAFDVNPALWFVGLVTALLTAFYMTRQVILTFFGRTRFFDAHADEIDAAFAGRIDAASGGIEAARADLLKAQEALDKANADLPKRHEAIEKAATGLAEASAAVEASSPEAEGHDKLVKAFDKATKAVPKADDAMAKAQAKVADAEVALVAAEQAQVDAAALRQDLDAARRNAPVVPQHVTALTPAPDISEFEDSMPASYQARQEYHPHESPWTMTLPLVVLSGLAIVAGGLNLPFTKDLHFLEHWLEPSLFANEHHLSVGTGMKWVLAAIAIAVGLIAIASAFAVYLRGGADPETIENPNLGLAVTYDRAIASVAGGPGTEGFERAAWFDKTIVDGAVNGVPTLISATASRARGLQSGFVRSYGLVVVLGTAALAVVLLRSLVL